MKRKSILFLVILTVPVLLMACGGSKPASSSAAATPETVVVSTMTFNKLPESYDKVNDAVNHYISEKYPDANVALSLQLYGIPDFFEKVPLALTSGQKLDVFLTVNLPSDAANGMLLPLNDLLDKYGQGVKDIFKSDFGEGAFDCTTIDENIYALPVNKAVAIPMMILYDKELLEGLGYTADDITDLDSIEKIMEECLAKQPNVIPFHPLNQGNTCLLLWMTQEYNIDRLGGTDFQGPFPGVSMNGSQTVENLYETDAFKDGVARMNRWYEKGYIQKDAATAQAIATEYFSAGKCLFTLGGYSSDGAAVSVSAMSRRDVGMKQITGKYYMDSTAISIDMGISAKTDVPDASMKMLSLIYTDPFILNTILYGIEGEDYVKVGDRFWSYPEGKDANTVSYTAALSTGVIGSESLQLLAYDPSLPEETAIASFEKALENNRSSIRSPYFGYMFNPTKVINELAAVTAVNSQYIKGFECGSLDVSAIDEFNKALYDAGLQNIIDEKQAQLDAFVASKK